MSGQAARRMRLLSLRNIEHRVAVSRLAGADATVANLNRIAERLAILRASLGTRQGHTNGIALNAMAEMSHRLDQARDGIAAPMSDADARRIELSALRIKARQKENSAEKLHRKAVNEETYLQDRLADAQRPASRKRLKYLDSES